MKVAARVGFKGTDTEFCIWLTEHAKVTAIPMSVFYHPSNGPAPQNLIRLCFAKKREVLQDALRHLAKI